MTKSSPWRSPVFLIWSGLLLMFFIANGVFIYLAQTNDPGLVVDNYYERGQDYEKNMLKRMAQDPGWNMRIEPAPKLIQNTKGEVRFFLSDKEGKLLVPDSVQFFAYRPTHKEGDFDVPMEELQNGVYRAMVAFPLPGIWDVLVVVTKDGAEYSEALRVNVAKPE
ncbi:FixH family protein [Motiliproteus sp.]|uniref:FixH family protein n=1 Tax=Motiliproteus sp. TaxID=1898955 RepID=UPI003BA9C754